MNINRRGEKYVVETPEDCVLDCVRLFIRYLDVEPLPRCDYFD